MVMVMVKVKVAVMIAVTVTVPFNGNGVVDLDTGQTERAAVLPNCLQAGVKCISRVFEFVLSFVEYAKIV